MKFDKSKLQLVIEEEYEYETTIFRAIVLYDGEEVASDSRTSHDSMHWCPHCDREV